MHHKVYVSQYNISGETSITIMKFSNSTSQLLRNESKVIDKLQLELIRFYWEFCMIKQKLSTKVREHCVVKYDNE